MNPPDSPAAHPVQPVWIRLPQAVQITGLSRSKIYELLAEGRIRSASLRDPGQRHATRLIDRADLLAFIERHASGGRGQIQAAAW